MEQTALFRSPGDAAAAHRGRLPLVPALLARAERCQYEQTPRQRPLPLRWARAAHVWRRRRSFADEQVAPGPASVYRPGQWVRVRSSEEIAALLDERGRGRGLRFTDEQWTFCDGVYEVDRVVQRLIGDEYAVSAVSRAVTLAGVTCEGADGGLGCGRSCALIFKDEWLEPAEPPLEPQRLPRRTVYATVRSAAAIRATLRADGRLDGLSPHPEMLALAGQRFPVARTLDLTREGAGVFPDWFVLDGVRCSGAVLGAAGPCDRRCGLLWHRSWLELEPAESGAEGG